MPTIGSSLLTGAGLGVVHVLTGPDHLSALCTLASGGSYKAFIYGVRWGLGHSTGLLIVAAILLIGDSSGGFVMKDSTEHFFEACVGGFMIALGVYGCGHAYREYQSDSAVLAEDRLLKESGITVHGDAGGGGEEYDLSSIVPKIKEEVELGIELGELKGGKEGGGGGEAGYPASAPPPSPPSTPSSSPRSSGSCAACDGDVTQGHTHEEYGQPDSSHSHSHSHVPKCCQSQLKDSPTMNKLVSFGVGIIHGIAGPGGILGVIPAIHLGGVKAAFYLVSFCFTSVLVMALFAGCWGHTTSKLANTKSLQFKMNIFSSFLSIAVGLLWCVLIYLGKLGDYFD